MDAEPRIWAVMALEMTADLSVLSGEVTVPLRFAEGMIGVLPVFGNRESAEAYAGGRFTVACLSAP